MINGHTIIVKFPDFESGMHGTTYEQIAEYFDFEVVTYSPTAETDAVQ